VKEQNKQKLEGAEKRA